MYDAIMWPGSTPWDIPTLSHVVLFIGSYLDCSLTTDDHRCIRLNARLYSRFHSFTAFMIAVEAKEHRTLHFIIISLVDAGSHNTIGRLY